MKPNKASALDAGLEALPTAMRQRVVLFRLLMALGGHLRGLMDQRLRPDGITTQQAYCLTIAGSADAPLTQGELAARMGVTHQNVRQLITSLEAKGLIEIRIDPADRRVHRIVPTPAVQTLFRARDAADCAAVAAWFAVLDDQEVAGLDGLLRRLLGSLADHRDRKPTDP